jgi:hypothetical protein
MMQIVLCVSVGLSEQLWSCSAKRVYRAYSIHGYLLSGIVDWRWEPIHYVHEFYW